MNDTQLKAAIDLQPYDKITEEGIKSRIKECQTFVIPDTTVTVVNITMLNGFSFRGESACVDPRNFNAKIGEELAYRDAFRKIWAFEGYLLAEIRYQESLEVK